MCCGYLTFINEQEHGSEGGEDDTNELGKLLGHTTTKARLGAQHTLTYTYQHLHSNDTC